MPCRNGAASEGSCTHWRDLSAPPPAPGYPRHQPQRTSHREPGGDPHDAFPDHGNPSVEYSNRTFRPVIRDNLDEPGMVTGWAGDHRDE